MGFLTDIMNTGHTKMEAINNEVEEMKEKLERYKDKQLIPMANKCPGDHIELVKKLAAVSILRERGY